MVSVTDHSKQTTFITDPFITDPFITDYVHNRPHSQQTLFVSRAGRGKVC